MSPTFWLINLPKSAWILPEESSPDELPDTSAVIAFSSSDSFADGKLFLDAVLVYFAAASFIFLPNTIVLVRVFSVRWFVLLRPLHVHSPTANNPGREVLFAASVSIPFTARWATGR